MWKRRSFVHTLLDKRRCIVPTLLTKRRSFVHTLLTKLPSFSQHCCVNDVPPSFTQQCWENDGSLVNNVGAMHRRLSNNVWTNDGRFHNNVWTNDGRFNIQCWLNDRRLVEFMSLLYRVSPVWLVVVGIINYKHTPRLNNVKINLRQNTIIHARRPTFNWDINIIIPYRDQHLPQGSESPGH